MFREGRAQRSNDKVILKYRILLMLMLFSTFQPIIPSWWGFNAIWYGLWPLMHDFPALMLFSHHTENRIGSTIRSRSCSCFDNFGQLVNLTTRNVHSTNNASLSHYGMNINAPQIMYSQFAHNQTLEWFIQCTFRLILYTRSEIIVISIAIKFISGSNVSSNDSKHSMVFWFLKNKSISFTGMVCMRFLQCVCCRSILALPNGTL